MLRAVTGQTAIIRLVFGERFETDDLADIAPTLNVERARAVAGLAAVAIFQSSLEVGGKFKILLVKFLMTGLASIGSDVLAFSGVMCCSLLLLFAGGGSPDDEKQKCGQ